LKLLGPPEQPNFVYADSPKTVREEFGRPPSGPRLYPFRSSLASCLFRRSISPGTLPFDQNATRSLLFFPRCPFRIAFTSLPDFIPSCLLKRRAGDYGMSLPGDLRLAHRFLPPSTLFLREPNLSRGSAGLLVHFSPPRSSFFDLFDDFAVLRLSRSRSEFLPQQPIPCLLSFFLRSYFSNNGNNCRLLGVFAELWTFCFLRGGHNRPPAALVHKRSAFVERALLESFCMERWVKAASVGFSRRLLGHPTLQDFPSLGLSTSPYRFFLVTDQPRVFFVNMLPDQKS